MKSKIYFQKHLQISVLFLVFVIMGVCGHSQSVKRNSSIWWVGESVAGNFNFYGGTTQMLNESVTVPTAFHNGEGLRLYFSFLAEYRKNKILGWMLNVAFNNRSSSFDGVITPNSKKAFLYTVLRYVNIEPSIRIAPFSSGFYVFGGPTLSVNSTKEFFYEQEGQHETRGDWSNLRKYVIGAQAGAGVDIPISKKTSANQLTISPFVSFQTNLFDNPRRSESWNIYTLRTGVAVKFGTHKITVSPKLNTLPGSLADPLKVVKSDSVSLMNQDIQFSVRAPKIRIPSRFSKEIFPLRNSIFFNEGSAAIPDRYVQLNKSEGSIFQENQLQHNRPLNSYNNLPGRQLFIYHNILNILGDRLRNNPQSTIGLSTGQFGNANDGLVLKDNIRQYLVTVFGIDPSRIYNIEGLNDFVASQKPGNTNDLSLKNVEDRRVDITSSFPQLLIPYSTNMAHIDTPENMVLFTADDPSRQLQSWSIDVTDDYGSTKKFGPYTNDSASVPVKIILGNSLQGNYSIIIRGITKNGQTINKESMVSLLSIDDIVTPVLRYSVLFDFDKSKTVSTNEAFLIKTVAPLVTDSSTVIIYGHTDIIGDGKYNLALSADRVSNARQILERVLSSNGRKGVKF